MISNIFHKPRGCFGWVLRILLVGIFLLAALLTVGNIVQRRATASDFEQFPAPGQLVEVDGHRMHIYCQGEGGPTVIADAGNGDFSLAWGLVQPEAAQFVRICVYDRAGYGWSDPSPAPRTAQNMATELHALLKNAGIEGPYILVGHSLGGLNVRMYASLYPDEVAGMVLVDSTHEDFLTQLPAEFTRILQQQAVERAVMGNMAQFGALRMMGESAGARFIPEHIKLLPADQQKAYLLLTSHPNFFDTARAEMQSLDDSCEQVRQAGDLGDLPLVVLAAGNGQNAEALQAAGVTDDLPFDEIQAAAQALQEDLATLSTNSTHIVADGSGHFVQFDRPDLVIAVIQQILDQIRSQASQ